MNFYDVDHPLNYLMLIGKIRVVVAIIEDQFLLIDNRELSFFFGKIFCSVVSIKHILVNKNIIKQMQQ